MNEFDLGLFSRRLQIVLEYRTESKQYAPWAEEHGFAQNTMSQWLRGKNPPSVPALFKLCKELDVSADFLLGLEE